MLAFLSTSARAEFRAIPTPEEKEWNFSVSGGVMYGSAYLGSGKYKAMPFPNLSVDYVDGLFFASLFDGIGSYPIRGENFKIGASIGFGFGRDEDDDKKNLRGMGDIDTSPTANLMGEYSFGPIQISGKLTKGNDNYGMTASVEVGTSFPVVDDIMFMVSAGPTWTDTDHMNTYFFHAGSKLRI